MTDQATTISKQLSVESYAAAVASSSPTPGGGSVAATVGALAAGLCEMVCALTLKGKHAPTHPERLVIAATVSGRLRASLLDLATADERAYAGYRSASDLPRTNDQEKADRREALDRALVRAAETPTEIAEAALETLRQLRVAAKFGTKHALSDVLTGAMLASAAVTSALLNVRVNTELMRDPEIARSFAARADEIDIDCQTLDLAIKHEIEER